MRARPLLPPLLAAVLLAAPLAAGCAELGSFAGLGTAIAEHAAISQASFSFEGVRLVKADVPLVTPNAGALLNVDVGVKNPAPTAATLDALDYQLLMEGAAVGAGSLTTGFSVPAGETRTLTIPVTVPYANLPTAAMTAIQSRKAAFTFKGTTHVQTPLGPLSFPIELSQTTAF